MNARAFFDSNLLVYLFDRADQAKSEVAAAVLRSHAPVVSAQVLSEFYWVTTRKLLCRLPPTTAQAAVAEFANFEVVSLDSTLVSRAIETSQRCELSYWDALIVEAAASAGCEELLTEDLAAGSTLRGVRIVNPFAGM
ncbi:MAG: PIN domain-containing protein [Bifidobacteriaceae bacterium]|jgi:predicted nucleic acid-binding protein|nr:PIN domain-containing protein [Bifidobacteriaceae bacterium]